MTLNFGFGSRPSRQPSTRKCSRGSIPASATSLVGSQVEFGVRLRLDQHPLPMAFRGRRGDLVGVQQVRRQGVSQLRGASPAACGPGGRCRRDADRTISRPSAAADQIVVERVPASPDDLRIGLDIGPRREPRRRIAVLAPAALGIVPDGIQGRAGQLRIGGAVEVAIDRGGDDPADLVGGGLGAHTVRIPLRRKGSVQQMAGPINRSDGASRALRRRLPARRARADLASNNRWRTDLP